MKIQKLIFTLTFTLFALTGMLATNGYPPLVPSECRPFIQLNKTMQMELQLTNEQFEKIWVLNQTYWRSRKHLLNTPNKIGQHTALLACWDEWQMKLSSHLTESEMKKFMQWQSNVDLLSEMPY